MVVEEGVAGRVTEQNALSIRPSEIQRIGESVLVLSASAAVHGGGIVVGVLGGSAVPRSGLMGITSMRGARLTVGEFSYSGRGTHMGMVIVFLGGTTQNRRASVSCR